MLLTALDAPADKLDAHEQNFVAKVREHGWFNTQVIGDAEGPGFFYTTGFWLRHRLPELIVFSIKRDVAHDILWHVYREAAAGASFPTGERLSTLVNQAEAILLPVSKSLYPEYLG